MDGILGLQDEVVEDEEHKQINSRLCSLIRRLWTKERGVKGPYGPSLKLRSTNAAILLEDGDNRRGGVRARVDLLLRNLKEFNMEGEGEGKRWFESTGARR